ncbi:MAG: GLPGLI family protein [Flavobacterium sp.]
MKNLLTLLLAIYSGISFAQANKSDLKVEYKLYCDTDVPIKVSHLLSVKNNVAIYQQKLSTTERWTEKPAKYEMNIAKIQGDFEPYMKIDRKKREMFFFEAVGQNIFLVKDNYAELKWKILDETKTVAGYTCNKATATYRGRDWIAWFTPEIPAPFGPWKLHGLPGLILEAADATGRYTYTAVKIEAATDEVFAKEFASLMETKSKKPVTIRQYIADTEEYSDNQIKLLAANKDFKIEVKKEPRKGEELIYEWEQ